MSEKGKYLYCIIKEDKERKFGSIGINNREVSLINYKDISAVVSPTPVINFDRLDKKELTRHVATHQQVNEEIMKDYDAVPMTFGIIAPSVDEVLRILERAYLQFKTALKRVTAKVEFAVQVRWEPKNILEELRKTDSDIQKLAGSSNILTKLKLGRLIQQKAETQRQGFIKDIQEMLSNLVYESTSNKLIDDDMIANLSFLIGKAKEPELDKKMQELGKKYEGKLRFKYIGPMPAYSFSNINLKLGNFEVVDEARKLLELPEHVSFDEIKLAYYDLAHQRHPDKYGGTAGDEKMKKIAQAYSILKNYCQSCDKFLGRQIEKYSLSKEDIENSLIIK